MEVAEKLWKNTIAGEEIDLFPGRLAEFFVNRPAKIAERAKIFLPHIFWRWYFLESEIYEGTNPYFNLKDLQEIEKWPEDGQFFPQPEIEKTGENNYTVSVNLDYISFEEQPLIVDLKNILDKKKIIYNYDNKYRSDLDFLSNYCRKQGLSKDDLSINKINQLIEIYLEKNLDEWYDQDPFSQQAFTKESWNRFWKQIIKEIGQSKDYSTERLLDSFISRMRQFFSDYGLKSDEFSENKFGEKNFGAESFFFFWINFTHYILLPFSFYLLLLAPGFLDKECFQNDIDEITNHSYADPIPIYSACSYLFFTNFGKKAFVFLESV